MPQARDVMTETLTTCSPHDSVAKAAKLMRDRNIGDVLVTDDRRLVGILTDRDIALRVTAKSHNPDQVSVHDVMSTRVLTGEPSWDLDHIAKTMGKHQIRRLPIAENGVPIGMVSLSDIALQNDHKSHVANSLKAISESQGTRRLRPLKRGLLRVTLGLGLLIGALVALNLFPNPGARLREQLQDSQIGSKLQVVVRTGRDRMAAALDSE